jgi:cell division septum initiation protein DivIVA
MAETLKQEAAGDVATAGADASARQLHDRATRGDTLTEAERASLTAWYERQDAVEEAQIASSTPRAEATLRHLRDEVEAASARMLMVTQDVQMLIAENEALRQEIAALTRRLARSATPQPA